MKCDFLKNILDSVCDHGFRQRGLFLAFHQQALKGSHVERNSACDRLENRVNEALVPIGGREWLLRCQIYRDTCATPLSLRAVAD
jgi:hypothetical protein